MPVGKQIGKYQGAFNAVRTVSRNGAEEVAEGSYQAKVSGDLSGNAVGTMTFTGSTERGTMHDLGNGYLDSGDVLQYEARGVYWASGKGTWQTRAAVVMGDQMSVVEGEVNMSDKGFTLKGGVFELT
ncbi:MAG: hypothetical protein ACU85V_02290 [Gammaproteobacteria bacterium]